MAAKKIDTEVTKESKFDPAEVIPNWDKLPEHIRERRLNRYGLNSLGEPVAREVVKSKIEDVGIEEQLIKVEGISSKLTLKDAVAIRDSLNKAIDSMKVLV